MAARLPSDLLDERRSAMRRANATVPTIEELMKHASKFGSEAVVETAVELGYGLDACIRLTDHCDRVDVERYHKEHTYGSPKAPKPSETRCKDLLGITDDDEDCL